MSIQVGDKIPACTMKIMGAEGPQDITTDDIFGGKKVMLFAVPGAFTPGCSMTHLPGYVVNADKIKASGVDSIVCMAVNDAFVMDAWGKAQNAEEIMMLADGNGEFMFAKDPLYYFKALFPRLRHGRWIVRFTEPAVFVCRNIVVGQQMYPLFGTVK